MYAVAVQAVTDANRQTEIGRRIEGIRSEDAPLFQVGREQEPRDIRFWLDKDHVGYRRGQIALAG